MKVNILGLKVEQSLLYALLAGGATYVVVGGKSVSDVWNRLNSPSAGLPPIGKDVFGPPPIRVTDPNRAPYMASNDQGAQNWGIQADKTGAKYWVAPGTRLVEGPGGPYTVWIGMTAHVASTSPNPDQL